MALQLNIHQTELFDMKLFVDFPGFTMICATWSLNCFCFDFHISAEQFYDWNTQLVKTGEKHNLTENAMSNDGPSIKIIDWSNGD